MKLTDPTHIAKIKVSKRRNGESHQADYAWVDFLVGYSLLNSKSEKYENHILSKRFLKEGHQRGSQRIEFSVPTFPV